MAPLMSLKGLNFSNSDIELYDDRLTIKHFMLPRHEFPVRSIVKIEYFSRPGLLSQGIMNVSSKDDRGNFRTEAIFFNKNGADTVEKLRLLLEDLRKGVQPAAKPPAFVPPAPSAPPVLPEKQASSGVDEIEKLAGLKAKGIITEDEFEAKKHQLLFGEKSGPVIREKEIVREIVRVPCAYCGVLMDLTDSKCPTCGAPVKRR